MVLSKSHLGRLARLTQLRSKETLLFCHIPKCAGTSLLDVVKSEYWPHQRLFVYQAELDLTRPDPAFLEQFNRRRNSIQLIYGHFDFGVHRFLDVPPLYATILREPVARVASLYHHAARDPSAPLHARVKAGLTLKRFVSDRVTEMTHNQMTRMMAGVPPDPGVPVYDEALLESAKENIERYFCAVGTIETMDDFLKNLRQRFSWRNYEIPNLNAMTQPRVEIDDETGNVIREHNRLDLALYDWVKSRD